jgi:succinate dehydrogenase / fumarate reductase membrane anchor subunit
VSVLSGHGAFLLQRLSALLLVVYLAAGALRLAFGPPVTFAQWQAWNGHPLGAAASLVLVLAVLLHAWVGVRDVILDYIHPFGLRAAALAAAGVGLASLGFWTLLILFRHLVPA